MKTIKIKGNEYVQVNERVKAFRSALDFKGWGIETHVHELTDDVCVMQAVILDPAGVPKATGWARELRNDAASMVNRTSYVVNCETSAVGRALGFLGIGIDESICSADELNYALQEQERQQKAPAAPMINKGGAIYPAKEPTNNDEVDQLLADINSIENPNDLVGLMKSDRVQKSPYKEALTRAGHNYAKRKGWE